MKFKPLALGLTLGTLWSVMLCLTTLLSAFTGYGREFLTALAGSIYPGYTISVRGSIIGMAYGFVDLFLMGVLTGWLYNKIADKFR